jgi:hypothetical protein
MRKILKGNRSNELSQSVGFVLGEIKRQRDGDLQIGTQQEPMLM